MAATIDDFCTVICMVG